LVRGRPFTDAEAATAGDRPAVVSAAMARELWPNADALGRRFLALGAKPSENRSYYVTGIAADVPQSSLSESAEIFGYLAAAPDNPLGMQFIVATNGDVPITSAVTAAAGAIDPAIIVETERFEDRLALLIRPARVAGLFAMSLGALAMCLASIGVYGIVSYGASQRTKEIAIRLALGSSRSRVISLMMRQGIWAVGVGAAVGLLLAAGASQGLQGLLFGLSPIDPVAYAAMAALLVGAALLAMYAPARRAAAVDPAAMLREE
jgi:cell division protein FtsX